jgi:hypothetical protein
VKIDCKKKLERKDLEPERDRDRKRGRGKEMGKRGKIYKEEVQVFCRWRMREFIFGAKKDIYGDELE